MDSWIASVRLLPSIFLYNPSYRHLILFLLCNCLGKMTRSQGRRILRNFCTVFQSGYSILCFHQQYLRVQKKFQHWLKNLCNFRLSDPFTIVRGLTFQQFHNFSKQCHLLCLPQAVLDSNLSDLQLIAYLYERKRVLILYSCLLIRMQKKKKECQLRRKILSSSGSTSQKIKLTSLSTILPFGSPSILLCYQRISLQVPHVRLLSL